jgi:hypothetical protein
MVLILSIGIWYDIYLKFQIQFLFVLHMLQRPGISSAYDFRFS